MPDFKQDFYHRIHKLIIATSTKSQIKQLVVSLYEDVCINLLYLVFNLCHEFFMIVLLLVQISEQFGKELRENIAPKFWSFFKVIF
jgi:hypothetical protein